MVRQGVEQRLEIRALEELENIVWCVCVLGEAKTARAKREKKIREWGSEKGVLCVVIWRRASSQAEER